MSEEEEMKVLTSLCSDVPQKRAMRGSERGGEESGGRTGGELEEVEALKCV